MHLGNGRYLVAELPIEHLVLYSENHKLGVFYNKGTDCLCCGDKGIHLVITTDKNGEVMWQELYTSDWTVMTVDHIVAKAKGGLNVMDNFQPLCRWCNNIKSDHDWTIEELRAIIKHRYKNML